jgi:hypothetical protein
MPICGKVEPLLLRYTYHHMQQEQVFRPICGKVGPLLLGHTHTHSRSKYSGHYVVMYAHSFLNTLLISVTVRTSIQANIRESWAT